VLPPPQEDSGCAAASYDDSQDGPLFYSIDTWTRELSEFVQQVVQRPAYVAGACDVACVARRYGPKHL
jgi:hypothetical protein